MKKNVLTLGISAFLILCGLAYYACDDGPDPDLAIGDKIMNIKVVDENGELVAASVSVKKNGVEFTSILVNGTYALNAPLDESQSVFSFKASQDGYIDSREESIILMHDNVTDSFDSFVTLQLTKVGTMKVNISPTQENDFTLPSSLFPTKQIQVMIPAGAVDKEVTLTPTIVQTAGFQGEIDADAPNKSFALEIIDFRSNWTGDFLNGEKVDVTFPLSQGIIDEVVNKGIPLVMGTNSKGSWESYPVAVNKTALTGTASLPHFSTWYLTLNVSIEVSITQTPLEILATGTCGSNLTATFTKENVALPEFYQKLFNKTSLPNISQTETKTGTNGKYLVISGQCIQKTISVEGSNNTIPEFTYFVDVVAFRATAFDCTHSGGEGQ